MIERRAKTLRDPIQLQQKVIHLQSELKRYQNIIDNYENNYQMKQFQKLEEENDSLKEQLWDIENGFQNKIDELKKEISIKKKENKKLTHTLEDLRQLKEDKVTVEKDLLKMADTLATERDNFNFRLTQLAKENEELNRKYTALEEKYQSLNHSLIGMSSDLNRSSGTNHSLSVDEMKIINELDSQFKDLLIQSFNNDKLLDPKHILIKELERKIDRLTKEIDDIETVNENSIK